MSRRGPSPYAPALATIVGLFAVYPLVRFLLVPLVPALAPPHAQTPGLDSAQLGAAVANSARIGVETGIAALLPATLIGFLLERRTWAGGPWLGACLWALFLTPSYLLTGGWQILMSIPALRDTALQRLFFSEVGVVALLALKGLPFAALTARTGWALVGGEIGAAARIHVPGRPRRALILGRLLAPVAAAAFAIVFTEAIGDFGVAATLGAQLHLPLVIYAIYARLSRTPVDFAQASILSLVLVALAGVAVMLHQRASRDAPALVGGRSRPAPRPPTSLWEAAAGTVLIAGLAGAAVAIPALALCSQAAAGGASAALAPEEIASILYSLCYATAAAGVAVALALALLSLAGSRAGVGTAHALDALTLGAMAVPGVVLGAAYVIAFNGWLPLYGTPALLIAAYVATHLPVLMRFLKAPLQSAHRNLADAARLHGMGFLARLERVHAPLLLRPVLWGWALAFGGIVFELPLSTLLHPAGRPSLGVELLSLDETLRFGAEARLALLGGAACLAIVAVVTALLPRWLARRAATVAPPAATRAGQVAGFQRGTA